MPKNRGILDRQILPGSINRVVFTTHRGKFIAKKWPKKAGKATAPPLITSQQRFAEAQQLIKYVTGDDMDDAIQVAKGTGLYPRDVLMSAMTVGLYDLANVGKYLITNGVYYLRPKMFQGAIVEKASNQSVPAATPTTITWDDPVLQTVPILFPAQPTRLVVPTGVTVVELSVSLRSVATNNGAHQLLIRDKNNDIVSGIQETSNQRVTLACSTGPIVVSPGDWFVASIFFAASGTIDHTFGTRFSMSLLQVTI